MAEVEEPDAALEVVAGLDLGGFHLFHAVGADLLRRHDRREEAALAYDAAIAGPTTRPSGPSCSAAASRRRHP